MSDENESRAEDALASNPTNRRLRLLAAVIALGALLTAVAAVVLSQTVGTTAFYWGDAANAATYSVIGAIVACNRPKHPIGWLILLVAASGAAGACLPELGRLAQDAGHSLPAAVIGWFAGWIYWPMIGSLPLLGLLFPDGRLPSRRWRPVLFTFVGVLVAPTVALIIVAFIDPTAALVDPVNLADTIIMKVNVPAGIAVMVCIPVAAVAVVTRWRRASSLERRQHVWLAWALSVWAIWQLATWLTPEAVWADRRVMGEIGFVVVDALIPAAIAVAVLRYRLYAIDIIVRKSLIWALLTVAIITTYVATVALLGATIMRGDPRPRSLIAAAVVAVGLAPLQRWLQTLADRAIYGRRGDPAAVLADLTSDVQQAVDPGNVLPTLVSGLAQALKLPYVAVEPEQGRIVAHGKAMGHLLRLPLIQFGAPIGTLVVSDRGASDPLSPADRRVLDHVRSIASTAVYATNLSIKLRRSREGVVRAREEERRRVRRDLHDGVASGLVGVGLGVTAARLANDRGVAADISKHLETAAALVQDVHDELSRVVEDLQPVPLDDVGLEAAIRLHCERLSAACTPGTLVFELQVIKPLPELPAAVEVAAYRIVVEAVTNVVKHARGHTCQIALAISEDRALLIEIRDDGGGITSRWRGVGLDSMRARAAELGGSFSMQGQPGDGTVVQAVLPIEELS